MAIGRTESILWTILIGLTLVGGSFNVSRLDPRLASWGLLEHFATWALVGWLAVWLMVLLPRMITGNIDLFATAPPLKAQLALFLLLHLYVILSATWAQTTDMTLVRVVQLFMMLTVIVTGIVLLPQDVELAVDNYLRLFASLAVIGLAFAIPTYLASPALQQGLQEQLTLGEAGGANTLARNLGIGLVATLALTRQKGRRWWWLLVPVLIGAIFLTGSRSGSLATIVGIMVFVAASGTGHRAPILISLGVGAVLAPFVLGELGLAHAAGLTWQQRFLEHTFREWNVSDRDVLFRYALVAWKQAPIFGLGLTGYASHLVADLGLTEPYSHNLVLDFLSEGGLFGLALLVICLVSFIGFRGAPATARSGACLAIAAVNATSGMFSGSYFDARFMWFALFLFGALRFHLPTPEAHAAQRA